MRDELLLYYERELNFVRQLGAEFAEKYPKVAGRLLLEPDKCEDPHVERLLEAFAFLAARVHLKIDDEFPEIVEALIGILYPHYLRPIPSMSIVQMHLDADKGGPTSPQKVPKGSLLNSRPVAGVPCQFQTCFETTVYPLTVTAGEWTSPDRLTPPVKSLESVAAIRLEVALPGELQLGKIGLDALRVHIAGEPGLANTLYELIFRNVTGILVRDPSNPRLRPVTLRPEAIKPVGFAEDEGLLPYPRRSFVGYRLLQEYFAMPEKFFFFDITGLEQVWINGFKGKAEFIFLLSPFEQYERRQVLELGVSAKTFRLNATPIINLYPQVCEPILLEQRKFEYPIIADIRRPDATEIFSVDEVVSINPQSRELMKFEPFYSHRHSSQRDRSQTFWLVNRRASGKSGDEGTNVYLSMVDLSTRPVRPTADTLTVRATCSNRDLAARLPFGNELGDFELLGGVTIKRIVALRKPTNTLRPAAGKGLLWRLMSHLSLNYLSVVEEGKEAMQQILKLYNVSGSSYAEKQIEGILSVKSERRFARIISENGITFARGTRVEMELDEEQFVGGGVYLFCAVLESFLGLYTSLNSYTQLAARTNQRKEMLQEWPPRAGRIILV